jgi:hypothetical protein
VISAAAEHGSAFLDGVMRFTPDAARSVMALRAKLPESALDWFDRQTPSRMVFLAKADEQEPPKRNRERRSKKVEEPDEGMDGDG